MKNKEILIDVIGNIDDKLIPEAAPEKPQKHIGKRLAVGGTFAAALIIAVLLLPNGNVDNQIMTPDATTNSKAESQSAASPLSDQYSDTRPLVAAVYPQLPLYPDVAMYYESDWESFSDDEQEWREAWLALRKQPDEYRNGFDTFFENSIGAFLSDENEDNKVYSPLSLYMALSMASETSDGNTRQQLLDALAQEDIETLRSHATSIWLASYMNDGMAKSILANSLWINETIAYNRETLNTLAETYYASSFSGDPASDEYNHRMQSWMDEQTDGLLQDYISDVKMNPQTVLSLVSTVNFSGKWRDPFSEEATKSGVFHSPGGETECEFMNTERQMQYSWGKQFSSIALDLENNGQMRLILPDEGVTPQELLRDEEIIDYMLLPYYGDYENSKYTSVTISVPKFDISSGIDLKEGLAALGVTDAFDNTKANFAPLTDDTNGIYLSGAEQNTRVLIDEKGCKASSMTVMSYSGAAPPSGHVDFVLDRPFIFEIINQAGLPLFVGVVNQPV